MTIVQQYLSTLRPAMQKLACLYAYIGQHLKDEDRLQLSVHGECLMGELPLMTAELIKDGFVVHEAATHFGPQREYIRPRMYGEVFRFGLEQHPEWFDEFDGWPLTRYADYDALQQMVRRCATGKRPQAMILDSALPPYLIGLVDDRRFEPLIPMIRDVDFPTFVSALARKWMKDDFNDPEEIMRREIGLRKFDATDPEIREMKALINYYNYVCRGEYTPPTSIRMTYSDFLLKGVHAMSQGKSDLALKVFAEALNMRGGKGKAPEPYLSDGVAAFYWVLAVWTSKQKSEAQKTLSAFVAYSQEKGMRRVAGAVLLADTLSHPLQRVDMDLLTKLISPEDIADREFILQQQLCLLLAANLTGYELTPEVFHPQSSFLRHEAERYITLNKFEKKRLSNAFGSKPISGVTKTADPWELMLDRLIASEAQYKEGVDEGEHRVMYVIMNDGESVELREQNRLKDGRWGSGKQLPWNRFISGSEPFMDRADQAVVADVRFLGASRLTIGIILPHMAGSDRVFTGEKMPYRRVTIEEQKPYIILEPTDDGFHLQSNVTFKDLLSQSNVYRRDDAMHYTYFPMSDHERVVLQQLLSVTDFPKTAEEKLRKLLPLIADTTDIHSSLLPQEEEYESSESQSNIIIRLTPDPTTQTMYDAYLLVRPLIGGKMVLPPAQGDQVIIDYSEKTGRVRIERDIATEARYLDSLLQYCQEKAIDISPALNAHLSTAQALDLLGFASSHQEFCSVEWPEGERLKMRTARQGDWNISLTPHGRWFEIEGDVKLDDASLLTAQQLLEALGNSHGGYVQLKNGDYLWLSERLRHQLDGLESLATMQNNHPAISMLQTGLLGEIVNGEIDIHHDEDFEALKQRIDKAEKLKPEIPDTLQATLRPYQVDGFEWLMRLSTWEAGACLADDMGLGKTVQTIAFLLAHAKEGPALVVAPASVAPNWRSEIERFAPSLNVYNLNEYFERQALVKQAKAGDVIITTYGLMVPAQDIITSREWTTVCLDEAHNIKNRGTKTSAVCMMLNARYRLILTGTPVQNHLGELWNLFQFINPGLLGSYEQFHQKYILPIENLQDSERQQQLQTLVSPFMLRRTKQAVAKELPDKTEINISVELTDDEMAFYEVIRREAEEKVREEGDQLTVNALAELTKLRRTACSAELTNPSWFEGSSKVNTFLELVQNIVEGGHSVLVFSQFTSFLSIVSRALKEAHLPHLYLDGSITIKQREQLVNDFQKGKSPIFLISLKAGGVGLNLTAANYVIHLDPWWNPAIEQQATDRAYRIGQTQAVTVYHLISHHTIEEKILRLHESKRALSDGILEGADQNFKLTAKDMLEMLSNNW